MEQTFTNLGVPSRQGDNSGSSAMLNAVPTPRIAYPDQRQTAAPALKAVTAARPAVASRHHVRNASIAFLALLGSICLAYRPDVFDRPVTRFINQWAHRSAVLDTTFWSLDACFVFSGFVLTALVWFCWFDTSSPEIRARLIVGSLVAFPAGCVSRLLQHKLATHPRPFYDQLLHFRAPYLLGDKPLNTWNSFPSDHVTVFAALLTIICIVRPRLGKLVIPYFIIVESARAYMGAHYPSDLLGGAALGALVVWIVQAPRATDFGRRILRWEAASPARFYTAAFALTWATSSLFLEPRTVGSYLLHALRHS